MTDYKSLVKQRTSIPGYIEEVKRFGTWWNNNLAIIINYYDGYYRVFLIVYEPSQRSMSENLQVFPTDISSNYWGKKSRGKHSYLSDAENEALWLKEEIYYDYFKGYLNPISIIHPYSDCSRSFSEFVKSPYVKETTLPYGQKRMEYNDDSGLYETMWNFIPSWYPDNPDEYLKPLDVVKIEKEKWITHVFYHFGIYLGNNKVCHVTDPYSSNKDTRNTNRVVITDWEKFIEGGVGELVRIHPLIPFRFYRFVVANIAWDENKRHIEGKYCLANNNCEHYVNNRIFGLSWSEQVAKEPNQASNYARYAGTNNGKSSFKLEDELEKSFNELDNWRSQEIQRKYEIEVPPYKDCRIM